MLTLLKRAWRGWLKFAHILGTIWMMIILSLMYWTIFALTAIPYKLLANSPNVRRSSPPRWVQRSANHEILRDMRNQG